MHTCTPSQLHVLPCSDQLLLKMLYTAFLCPWLAPYPACSLTQAASSLKEAKVRILRLNVQVKDLKLLLPFGKKRFQVCSQRVWHTLKGQLARSYRALVIYILCFSYPLHTTDTLIFCLLQIIISFWIQPFSLLLAYNNISRIISNSVNYKLQCGKSTQVHQCQWSPFYYFAFLAFLRDCLPTLQTHS